MASLTAGAGDTFDATVIFGLANGLDPERSVRLGCQVAGAKLGIYGFRSLREATKLTFKKDEDGKMSVVVASGSS
jgi:sugar/nucleoside kinase (ribokinase family)